MTAELDQAALAGRVRQRADEQFLVRADVRFGGLSELELPEGLLQLPPDSVERCVRVGGDHRADELERQPDRPGLERRQARRPAESVSPELLVDPHLVAVQLGVHGIATPSEVDEVEQRQVLLELIRRDVESLGQLRCIDHRPLLLSTPGEQMREQRLQDGEALWRNGPREALAGAVVIRRSGASGMANGKAVSLMSASFAPARDLVEGSGGGFARARAFPTRDCHHGRTQQAIADDIARLHHVHDASGWFAFARNFGNRLVKIGIEFAV